MLPTLLVALFLGTTEPQEQVQTDCPLVVMTYNLRFDNPDDGINAWPNRRETVLSLVRFQKVDILGTQEGLEHQIRYLVDSLQGFAAYGCGRDDGKQQGEYSAILVNTERFNVLQDSTFWLSPTPEVPGKGWDAALPRICTWVKLEDRESGERFFVFNTHFDHKGEQARVESARLLRRMVNRIAAHAPVIVTGDFNSVPQDSVYAVMTEQTNGTTIPLQDALKLSRTAHLGPDGTFAGFAGEVKTPPRIDYIFAGHGVEVLRHRTVDYTRDGRYPSDHMPVVSCMRVGRQGDAKSRE